ncbi:MAG: GGDEF domain-containing protein [Actinomycetota bacterium]
MSTRRLAPVVAAIAVGLLVVASAATQAAARDTTVVPGDELPDTVAALVATEVRLLAEVDAFSRPVPPGIVELADRWTLTEEQLADPLAELATIEGLSIGMGAELEAAGFDVPVALARVLRPTDDDTWTELTAGREGVMAGRDHALALVIVVDLMDRPLVEIIDELSAVDADDESRPALPTWMALTGVGLVLIGVGLAVRTASARRSASVDGWLRELSAPTDAEVIERVAVDLGRDLLPGSSIRLARPDDDDDPLVTSACALGSPVRRRGRLAIPAVGNGRIRRVLLVEPAPPRRLVDDVHELAALIGPAIARAEDHQAVAELDPLTDVFNRRRLDRDLGDLHAETSATSLLMVDVDHFKTWNDHHGHRAGDQALRQVASAIRRAVRPSDVVYRYGGEEFTVLLPETSAAEAAIVAERLRRAVAAVALRVDGEEIGTVTVSVGLADTDQGSAETLAERADAALYDAKRSGRDQVVVAGTSGAG